MINTSIYQFLNDRRLAVTQVENTGTFLDTRLFQMIRSGDAKLPLDRVEEVADLLNCDKHELFSMAMRQFYDDKAISTFERMLATPLTSEEQGWLHIIRSASDGPVAKPSVTAKRLVRALAKTQGAV